jgi:sugar phosphate isomerase/epimerase
MKLAVSTYSLQRWRKENNRTLEQSLEWIRRKGGVDAVEVSGTLAEREDDLLSRAKSLRKRCHNLGLRIVSYCVHAELLTSVGEQAKTVQRLRREVEAAAAMGAASMRHDVTRGVGAKSFAATLKQIVPPIREVADYAQTVGVKTSLENHGFYMQESTRVEKLIRAVAHENYGLTIDLGNFLCVNENPTDATRRLAKYVVMAHAKDFHVKPKSQMPPTGWFATPTKIALRGAIAGHGVLDLPAQLALLKKSGYDGYLSLEFEGMEEPTEAVTLGLNYLREVLREIEKK